MIRVDLHRAQDTIKSEPVSIATIQIHEPFPDGRVIEEPAGSYFARARAAFDDDATKLCHALLTVLPGGTIDALLVRLLDHKRSLFRVSHNRVSHDREGMTYSTYAALGEMVKSLIVTVENDRLAGTNVASGILRAIESLSATVGAEVRMYGAQDTYAKRW